MRRIDLNADVGEGFAETDAALIPLVTSANIACGGHAGDASTMEASVALCLAHGVAMGAHPSYPDREGFGRREIGIDRAVLQGELVAQIGALAAVVASRGARLAHVKPHGALYNRAAVDADVAQVVAEAVRAVDPSLVLVGLAGSRLLEAGRAVGLRTRGEGFADRRYSAQGLLVPRAEPGAVIDEEDRVRDQVMSMVLERQVHAPGGEVVPLSVDTVCLHGDGPHAVVFARLVRESLRAAGVQLVASPA